MAEVIFTPEELQAIAAQVAQNSDLASQILDYLKQLVEQDQQEP